MPSDPTSEPPPLSLAPDQPVQSTTPQPTAPTMPGGSTGAATLPEVVAAVEDLAVRLGVQPADITVADARFVTWPDSSAGCPQPGVGYMQVLTDGMLVVLEAAGSTHAYHSRGGGPLFLCTDPRPPLDG